MLSLREFIVSALVQFASGFFFADAAPLFEKESDFCAATLCANVSHPRSIHWPCARPTFTADNHPINIFQIERTEMFQQRFDGKKTDLRRGIAQQINARQTVLTIFNTHAPPGSAPAPPRISICLLAIVASGRRVWSAPDRCASWRLSSRARL